MKRMDHMIEHLYAEPESQMLWNRKEIIADYAEVTEIANELQARLDLARVYQDLYARFASAYYRVQQIENEIPKGTLSEWPVIRNETPLGTAIVVPLVRAMRGMVPWYEGEEQ